MKHQVIKISLSYAFELVHVGNVLRRADKSYVIDSSGLRRRLIVGEKELVCQVYFPFKLIRIFNKIENIIFNKIPLCFERFGI